MHVVRGGDKRLQRDVNIFLYSSVSVSFSKTKRKGLLVAKSGAISIIIGGEKLIIVAYYTALPSFSTPIAVSRLIF